MIDISSSERLRRFQRGFLIPCEIPEVEDEKKDGGVARPPPDWLDKDRFRRGQEFFMEYRFGILRSNYRNLVIGLVVPSLCDPMILTGQTSTVSRAFHRYLDTLFYTTRWYRELPWENPQAWITVNRAHRNAISKIRQMDQTEQDYRMLEMSTNKSLEDPLDVILLANLRRLRKQQRQPMTTSSSSSITLFSQSDMSLVQMAFFATFVTFPSLYGARFASESDLEDLVHFWRVVGYYLGVEDGYNFAEGSLEEVRGLYAEVVREMLVPALAKVSGRSLAMGKTVCRAFGASYHMTLYGHCYAHGIDIPDLWRAFTWRQKLGYWMKRLLLEYLYTVPPLRWSFNWMIERILARMLKGCPRGYNVREGEKS